MEEFKKKKVASPEPTPKKVSDKKSEPLLVPICVACGDTGHNTMANGAQCFCSVTERL